MNELGSSVYVFEQASSSLGKSINMIVAGGCHVGGYPLDLHSGFVYKTVRYLKEKYINVGENPKTLNLLSLSKAHLIDEVCKESKPDILILQLGNYESCPNYKKYFRKKLNRLKSNEHSTSISSASTAYRPVNFKPNFTWYLKNYLKCTLDIALNRKVIDLNKIELNTHEFFDIVSKHNIKNVIVLSPLPAADSTVMFYRNKISSIFSKYADIYGFNYINIIETSKGWKSEVNIFADSIHLNQIGHKMLGQYLGSKIKGIVTH